MNHSNKIHGNASDSSITHQALGVMETKAVNLDLSVLGRTRTCQLYHASPSPIMMN